MIEDESNRNEDYDKEKGRYSKCKKLPSRFFMALEMCFLGECKPRLLQGNPITQGASTINFSSGGDAPAIRLIAPITSHLLLLHATAPRKSSARLSTFSTSPERMLKDAKGCATSSTFPFRAVIYSFLSLLLCCLTC